MGSSESDLRQRVEEYKMAITKVIYKELDIDRSNDDQLAVFALAELTATYGARVMGREETTLILTELAKHVSETELNWPDFK